MQQGSPSHGDRLDCLRRLSNSKEILYFQPKKTEHLLLKKLSADADKVEIFNYLPSYDLFLFTHILITKVLGHVTL